MTIPRLFRLFMALVLLVVADLAHVALHGGPAGLIGPVFADDDGGDDGDDGGDDDGGGGGGGGGGGSSGGGGGGNGGGGGAGSGGTGRVEGTGAARRNPGAPPAARATPLPQQAAGEIVVSGLSEDDLAGLLSDGFALIETFSITLNGPVLHRLQVPDDLSLEAARELVRARATGQNADFNHYYRLGQASPDLLPTPAAAAPPAPCTHLNCPILSQIAWPEVRPPGCLATLDIGVIDTSVNLDHAGLSGTKIELIRLAGEDMPASGATHGTAVAALIAGTEARAPGLLPEARLLAIDIFSREGGDERADVAHLVQALDVLAQRGVRVANLSLAGPENTVLTDMLTAVADKGMLVVAASGNAGPAAPPAWPAAAETVLAVTAVDTGGRIYRKAQRGQHLDLAAPGVDVWSAASVEGVKPRTGTSFAAPFAAAAAAIVMSRDPTLTPQEAVGVLRSLTRDLGAAGADEVFGAGLLSLEGLCTTAMP